MNETTQYKGFLQFLKLLSDNGLLDHVILIGSWAEYVYSQSGLIENYEAQLRTLDIDFLVKNMKRPNPPANLAALARDEGYLVEQDILDGTTRIYSPDLLEIEFLIAQQGSGAQQVISTNVGVNAQAMRHISMLRDFAVQANIFGLVVLVPKPEAYVVHKIIINESRKNKAEKDRVAIANLMPYLGKEQLNMVYLSLTKKERAVYDEYCKKYLS